MQLVRIALAVLACVVALPAEAQEWPAKPVKVVVPFPPGGATDIAARVISDKLTKAFGQTFVVENRAGAAGNIGNELVARSAPDGYTLLVSTDGIASAPHVYKLAFDPMADLVPVIQLSRQPVVIAANPSLGVKTLADLVKLAKEKPGMGFATSGIGTQQHMAGEWFARLAGVKLLLVPYKGGGQAINDLVAGQVPLGVLGSSPIMPHHKTGKLIVLGQTTKARAPTLPDVPTLFESGFQELVLDQWLGVMVPKGTPAAIIQRLNASIDKALKDATVLERFAQGGLEAVGGSPEQFGVLIKGDFDKYRRIIALLGLKLE